MALICDVCKVRPADARVAFRSETGMRVVDVCRQDYHLLQEQSPYVNLPTLEEMAKADQGQDVRERFSEASQEVLGEAAKQAAQAGSRRVTAEHLLMALTTDELAENLLKERGIKTEDVRGFIEANLVKAQEVSGPIDMSVPVQKLLGQADVISREMGQDYVGPEHMLVALLGAEGTAGDLLRRYGLKPESLRQQILKRVDTDVAESASGTPTLDQYSRDLTALAEEAKLDPVIGRATEIETAVEILSRRTKNNPVLIGEPGVGKTAIVEGIAQKIVADEVPDTLKGKRLVELNLNSMISGSRYRGDFEERMKKVLEEIVSHKDELLVFVDELHTVVGTGSAEGGLDAANVLKPSLARGDLHLIGATTLKEYKKHIEKDSALERRFQPVLVGEPSLAEATAIIQGLKPRYEEFHKITISNAAVEGAVQLSDRYINDRFLPDKAIDLMDQAAARVHIAGKKKEVVFQDIAQIVSKLTGVPVTELDAEERESLLNLEEKLHGRVIGQDQAVDAVARAVRIARAGLARKNAPIASFLFLGPTGVGKTELAKALAASVFGSEGAITRIDMSEYMERHAVARLIGSPPGYVGHEEGGQLTESVRRKPYQVILLDEIEKAHPEVFNILLQLLDDGRLTDGQGKTVDFSNVIVIATSNIGSELHNRSATIGFEREEPEEAKASDSLRQYFRPELVNRLDEIITFHSLNQEQINQIVGLQLAGLSERLVEQGITPSWDKSLVRYLAEAGFNPEYGARELRRLIKREVEPVLANVLLESKPKKARKLKVAYKQGKVTVGK
ncbi:MAG: ATP-dependent Clp protease ATP-binding subunit [bacterium]